MLKIFNIATCVKAICMHNIGRAYTIHVYMKVFLEFTCPVVPIHDTAVTLIMLMALFIVVRYV